MADEQIPAPPAALDQNLEKLLNNVREWLQDPSPKPGALSIKRLVTMTPQGPARVFQLFLEDIRAQVTELPQTPSIIPANRMPPTNGVHR